MQNKKIIFFHVGYPLNIKKISMCTVDVMNSHVPCGCWYAHKDIWALPVEQFPLIMLYLDVSGFGS